MDEPSAKSASEFKVHAMMVNGKSSPGRALPAMADPASLVGPMHHDRFRSTEDTKHHLVESGPTRQSMRKRQSPRSSGTESDMCTPRNADLADCNGDRDSNAVLPDETDENGGPSPQSSRKRRSTTRAAKFLEMDVASIPFLAASDHAPSASKKSSLRHTMDTTNNAVENWEGSVTAGSTRQSTRSRMPRITYESEFNAIASSKEDATENHETLVQEEIKIEDEIYSIDAVASSLAMLDTRGYHRALLCDSSELLRRIVQPLALPWMHKGPPLSRNTAFDIDDMTETLLADDGSYTPHNDGPLGFGRYDAGQLRRGPINTRLATSSDSVCSASRRTADPGILEVSTIVLPLFYHRKSFQSVIPENNHELKHRGTLDGFDVHSPKGEITLRCHDRASRSRRRKVAEVRRSARRQLVSVKVGSSSSRSSIFTGINSGTESQFGKVLEATLPIEVQNGKVLTTMNARQVAESLGSYDWRHGFPKNNATGKLSKTSCGRTRLVWTDRNGPADQPQKVVYNSLLNGERLESGSQKRPRDIRVAIRLQGEKFASMPNANNLSLDFRENSIVGRTNAACVLDDEEFIKNVLADAQKSSSERSKARTRVASAHPVFDCLPDSNGAIGVVCTSPGKVTLSSVHERLNHAAKMSSLKCCTVCWSPDHDRYNPVNECAECGILAHTQCCYDAGEIEVIQTIDDSAKELSWWRCAVCCFKKSQPSAQGAKSSALLAEQASRSRRKPKLPQWLQDSHIDDTLPAGRPDHIQGEIASHGIKCALCPYHGGAMSPVKSGDDIVWMHEVCRLWHNGAVNGAQDDEEGKLQCALCGKTERRRTSKAPLDKHSAGRGFLIKCAGSRCQIFFHPMCALLSSRYSDMQLESGDPLSGQYHPFTAKGVDQRLGAAFTLSAVDCEAMTAKVGYDRMNRRTIQIPIGFCGIHNPQRLRTSRGLYPAGKHINNDTIRVPALRQQNM